MGKPREFDATEAGVAAVADELSKEGITPTNDLIIRRLGGGSKSDIAPHLRRWKAARAEKLVQQAATTTIPEAAEEAMHSAMQSVWRVAEAVSRHEVDEIEEAARKAVKDAEAERDEARTDRLRLLEEKKAADETIEKLRAENARLQGSLGAAEMNQANLEKRLKDDAALSAARLGELEARGGELQRQLIDAEHYVRESDVKRTKSEEAITRQEKALDISQHELASSREETARLGLELARATATAAALESRLHDEKIRFEGQGDRMSGLTRELVKVDKELSSVRAKSEALESRLADEKARYQDQEARLNELNKALIRLAESKKDK